MAIVVLIRSNLCHIFLAASGPYYYASFTSVPPRPVPPFGHAPMAQFETKSSMNNSYYQALQLNIKYFFCKSSDTFVGQL